MSIFFILLMLFFLIASQAFGEHQARKVSDLDQKYPKTKICPPHKWDRETDTSPIKCRHCGFVVGRDGKSETNDDIY